MSTAVITEPFSLAGMGDMLRETNPDLAAKTNVDEAQPQTQEPSPDPADDKKEDDTPAAVADAPEVTDDKKETAAASATGAPTADELEAEQQKQQQEKGAATKDQKKKDDDAAAQKTKDDDAAAAAKKTAADAKPGADDPREKRDADLNVNLSPHTHPKTRQIITSFKENARKARDERDAVAKEREELKRQLTDATEKAKGVAVPKEVDEELKLLRERVRELDITRDPQIEAKYDRPIAANNKSVVEILRGFGADQVADPKDPTKMVADPRFEANLLKAGVSLKTLQPYIEKLDKAGFVDEAEQLRESIRENTRLARAKQTEIESFKADYDTRIKTRTQQTEQQAQQEQQALQAATDTTLKTEIAELAKTMPFLNQPPAPQANDSEPVRKAKQAALDEYNAAANQIAEAMKGFSGGKTPEEARANSARFSAMAILGLIARHHVSPRFQKEIGARDARIKDLEAQIGKIKGATTLSRQHATLASQPNGQAQEIPSGAPTPDAFSAYAKAAGINVNS